MRNVVVLGIFISLLLFAAPSAQALSGPTGANQIRTEAGPGAGQVTINWQRYHPDVTGYTILYGYNRK